jgi:hypothetical protein
MWLPIRRFYLLTILRFSSHSRATSLTKSSVNGFLFSGSYYSRRESMCVIHLKSKVKTKKL